MSGRATYSANHAVRTLDQNSRVNMEAAVLNCPTIALCSRVERAPTTRRELSVDRDQSGLHRFERQGIVAIAWLSVPRHPVESSYHGEP
jgi:hypothetical protein